MWYKNNSVKEPFNKPLKSTGQLHVAFCCKEFSNNTTAGRTVLPYDFFYHSSNKYSTLLMFGFGSNNFSTL